MFDEKGSKEESDFLMYLKRIKVKAPTLAIADEIQSLVLSSLTSHAHMGSFNMATDFIGVTITPDTGKEDSGDLMKKFTDEVLKSISTTIKESDAINNPKKYSQIYIDKLTELDKLFAELGHGFVFHETNKIYTSIEGGKGFKKYGKNDIPAFRGREMSLINYINSIDQMAQFGISMGINVDWLRFLAYNIADTALGSDNVSELENILAIAGGLIMFDDFAAIAKEAATSFAFSSIDNIHLYKLNGVYVPASYFLKATYENLAQIQESTISADKFIASIKPPNDVDYSRTHAGPTAEDWNTVKSKAESATITLHFGANFLGLIDKLSRQ